MQQHSRFALFCVLAATCAFPNLSAADATPVGPSFVANSPGFGGLHSRVAVGPGGEFVVVWEGRSYGAATKGRPVIYARRFNADGTPVAAEMGVSIAAAAVDSVGEPDVVWNPAGGFAVVWSDNGYDFGAYIYVRRYGADGKAIDKAPLLVNTPQYVAHEPHAAFRADGAFVVAWSGYGIAGQYDSYGSKAFARSFSPQGVPYGPQFRLATGTGYSGVPDVAITSDGGFLAVWATTDPDNPYVSHVLTRHFGLAGLTKDPKEKVLDYGESPRLASNARGDLVVGWNDYSSQFARRFTGPGVPLDSVSFWLGSGDFDIFTPTSGPSAAIDAQGGSVYAWHDVSNNVWSRRLDRNGVPLESSAFKVNDVTYPPRYYDEYYIDPVWTPDVAGTPDGGFIVVWNDNSSSNPAGNTVRVRRFQAP